MIYRFEKFQLDEEDFRLSADGVTIALEPKALRVLLHLIRNRSRLVRKAELLANVWPNTNVTDSVLTRGIGLLRKALEDDSREPRFIQTVPTAGYRFVAEVRAAESGSSAATGGDALDEHPSSQAAPVVESEGTGRGPGVLRRALVRIAAAVCCLALLILLARLTGAPWRATVPIQSLAVLPLQNLSGDPGQDYLADGMTDAIITEVARIHGLRVVSRTSAMQQKGSGKSLQQIASELNVDAIVDGSVVRSGHRVRITAQFVEVRSDAHLWAESFEGEADDILALQDSVAGEIAAQTRIVLARKNKPLAMLRPPPPGGR